MDYCFGILPLVCKRAVNFQFFFYFLPIFFRKESSPIYLVAHSGAEDLLVSRDFQMDVWLTRKGE